MASEKINSMQKSSRLLIYFKNKKKLIINLFHQKPLFYSFLVLIIIVGGWLRLYHLEATMMFQGDQGRDALIVSKIFREFDLAFIGPVTSVGNMYLGPFYYYFMLPFLFLSYPSPIGPAVGVALVNIFTIFLIYLWGQEFVGKKAALWASFFFAFSNIAISHARFSWNPNLSVFFSLLTLYLTLKASKGSPKNWLGVALAAGLLIQLHYVNLILIPVIGIFWLKKLFLLHQKQKKDLKPFYLYSINSILIFCLTFIPLALFDWKYNWRNSQAALSIFNKESSFGLSGAETNLFITLTKIIEKIPGRLTHLFSTLLAPNLNNYSLRIALGFLLFSVIIYLCFFRPSKNFKLSLQLLGTSSIFSIFALAFYNHSVHDHYILFFLPILFLLLGYLCSLFSAKKYYPFLSLLIIFFYLLGNYRHGFFKPTAPQLSDLDKITNFLLAELKEDQTFDFLLLDENRNFLGDNFRYYFSTKTKQLLPIEKFYDADVYFIIDETLQANLYEQETYQIKTFLNYQDVTLSIIPYDGPKLYKFTRKATQL